MEMVNDVPCRSMYDWYSFKKRFFFLSIEAKNFLDTSKKFETVSQGYLCIRNDQILVFVKT